MLSHLLFAESCAVCADSMPSHFLGVESLAVCWLVWLFAELFAGCWVIGWLLIQCWIICCLRSHVLLPTHVVVCVRSAVLLIQHSLVVGDRLLIYSSFSFAFSASDYPGAWASMSKGRSHLISSLVFHFSRVPVIRFHALRRRLRV